MYWASSRPRGAPWSLDFTCASTVLQEWKLKRSHPECTTQFKSRKLAGSICRQTFPSPCIPPPAHKCIPYFGCYGSVMDANGGAPPRLAASLASGFHVLQLHGSEQRWKLPDLCGTHRCPTGGRLFHHLRSALLCSSHLGCCWRSWAGSELWAPHWAAWLLTSRGGDCSSRCLLSTTFWPSGWGIKGSHP